MKKTNLLLLALVFTTAFAKKNIEPIDQVRPPAVPLLTSDPYFSLWLAADNLYDRTTSHWTGKTQSLIGSIRVDGVNYRFLGDEQAKYKVILPTGKWNTQFSEQEPAGDWTGREFNDKSWHTGTGSFGNNDFPNRQNDWLSSDIWIRRTFDLKEDLSMEKLMVEYSHDDNFELYINGVKVVDTGYAWRNGVQLELSAEAKATLKKGPNVLAAHCHNRTGGAFVDFGLFKKVELNTGFNKTATQKSLKVLPTNTIYTFACGGVDLELTFTAPLLLNDLDLVSTPINYISYKVQSNDKKTHDVEIYLEATPQFAVNMEFQPVKYGICSKNGLSYVKTGTIDQPVLNKIGDDLRIDWGYLYMSAPVGKQLILGDYFKTKQAFSVNGKLPESADPAKLSPDMQEEMNVLAYADQLGQVGQQATKGYMMIGYDDISALRYFYEDYQAYWKHEGKVSITDAFEKASQNYASVMDKCNLFDNQMMKDAEKAGGKEYAALCALSYRQAIAAHKLAVDKHGDILFFSKENNSNGCINTVDVTYPSAPLFLLYNPDLMKGMLNGIFRYSESGRWTKPFPAHDLGTYPIANGQRYGGDMPVEEGGNMLILTAAIADREGNANYAAKHWDVLTIWADYLIQAGMDPENQLCTDDFAGHFAHNTNLSIKAILGIAGYGKLASMLGKNEIAEKYTRTAREMAIKWVEMAGDGDHFKLTFDKEGTWSQKYNLVWDKVLQLNIFPAVVAEKEVPFYLANQNKYGLPLDSRKTYTKNDWIMWTACLADNQQDFEKLVHPLLVYVNETESRVPLCDWHETTDGMAVGFKARSVVGGYFMKMLEVDSNK